jgi:hypothetical protein
MPLIVAVFARFIANKTKGLQSVLPYVFTAGFEVLAPIKHSTPMAKLPKLLL